MDDDRLFDATESYFCDAVEPAMSKWHTTSLVTALKGILERRPQFEQASPTGRVDAFRAAADELTRRGLDGLSLIRYGMFEIVASTIINVLARSTLADQERPGGMSRADADAWWAALDLPARPMFSDTPTPAEVRGLMEEVIRPSLPRIMSWIATASINELLEVTPPPAVIPADLDSGFPDEELQAQYAWAVDHFSSTFYTEWSTSSLYYAYRWLSGHEIPPCNPDLMSDRRIDDSKLNAEIARRAAMSRGFHKPRIDAILSNEMIDFAVSLLEGKRYREAAAIFEFAASQTPYEGRFQNNIGFCLIPEDPLEALGYLKTAAEMNYPNPATNVYNQMCCHIALHRPREALALADAMWSNIRATRPADATLWKRDDLTSDWVIFKSGNAQISVAELAIALAREEGWPTEEVAWRERREQIDS